MVVRNLSEVGLLDEATIHDLAAGLHGSLVTPLDSTYEEARKLWNGHINKRPGLIVQCQDEKDVILAIQFARRAGLEIAVRSGGHSIPGFSLSEGGMVIDLSRLKTIAVDPEQRTVRVGAGVKLGEFVDETQKYGLGTTIGIATDTGLAGLTLGGGVGWLMGKYGATCDNVRSFELITVDGQWLRASASENPDLFWGLRGGGGNFGIVTAFEYNLHPVGTVLAGMVMHPLAKAREALKFYRQFMHNAPDELATYAAMLTSPQGFPVIAFIVVYAGSLEEGERVIAPLRAFGPPLMANIAPMPYAATIRFIDEANPPGRNYYDKGIAFKDLDDAIIDELVAAGEALTSPYSALILQHVHGAVTRVPLAETAFPVRETCYMPTILAAWDEGPADAHIAWTRKTFKRLSPYALKLNYINFMGTEEQALLPPAFGQNYARLVALKRKYDPENIFHLNNNIPPA